MSILIMNSTFTGKIPHSLLCNLELYIKISTETFEIIKNRATGITGTYPIEELKDYIDVDKIKTTLP